jgi:hypothetical protein
MEFGWLEDMVVDILMTLLMGKECKADEDFHVAAFLMGDWFHTDALHRPVVVVEQLPSENGSCPRHDPPMVVAVLPGVRFHVHCDADGHVNAYGV